MFHVVQHFQSASRAAPQLTAWNRGLRPDKIPLSSAILLQPWCSDCARWTSGSSQPLRSQGVAVMGAPIDQTREFREAMWGAIARRIDSSWRIEIPAWEPDGTTSDTVACASSGPHEGHRTGVVMHLWNFAANAWHVKRVFVNLGSEFRAKFITCINYMTHLF